MNTRSLLYQLIVLPGQILLKSFDCLVTIFSRNLPVTPGEEVTAEQLLAQHQGDIYREFLQVYKASGMPGIHEFYSLNTDIGQDSDWTGFPLVVFSYGFEQNMAKCPCTIEVLRKIPGCTSAMFSVLAPGKYIKPHKGVYKGVYRCLFVLKAPEGGKSWIRVNGQQIPFESGKGVWFDETFEHEVMNDSDEIRAVLYLDVYRKMPFPLNVLNRFIFALLRRSPYVQNIIRNYNKLDQNTMGNFDNKSSMTI
jgi:beta-hydroxylase